MGKVSRMGNKKQGLFNRGTKTVQLPSLGSLASPPPPLHSRPPANSSLAYGIDLSSALVF